MLMYRFESSRSPTYMNTNHHSVCQHGKTERCMKLSSNETAKLPARPPDRVWSWGLWASSAPHPPSGRSSPDWKPKQQKSRIFILIVLKKENTFRRRHMQTGYLVIQFVITFRYAAEPGLWVDPDHFRWMTPLPLVFAWSFLTLLLTWL